MAARRVGLKLIKTDSTCNIINNARVVQNKDTDKSLQNQKRFYHERIQRRFKDEKIKEYDMKNESSATQNEVTNNNDIEEKVLPLPNDELNDMNDTKNVLDENIQSIRDEQTNLCNKPGLIDNNNMSKESQSEMTLTDIFNTFTNYNSSYSNLKSSGHNHWMPIGFLKGKRSYNMYKSNASSSTCNANSIATSFKAGIKEYSTANTQKSNSKINIVNRPHGKMDMTLLENFKYNDVDNEKNGNFSNICNPNNKQNINGLAFNDYMILSIIECIDNNININRLNLKGYNLFTNFDTNYINKDRNDILNKEGINNNAQIAGLSKVGHNIKNLMFTDYLNQSIADCINNNININGHNFIELNDITKRNMNDDEFQKKIKLSTNIKDSLENQIIFKNLKMSKSNIDDSRTKLPFITCPQINTTNIFDESIIHLVNSNNTFLALLNNVLTCTGNGLKYKDINKNNIKMLYSVVKQNVVVKSNNWEQYMTQYINTTNNFINDINNVLEQQTKVENNETDKYIAHSRNTNNNNFIDSSSAVLKQPQKSYNKNHTALKKNTKKNYSETKNKINKRKSNTIEEAAMYTNDIFMKKLENVNMLQTDNAKENFNISLQRSTNIFSTHLKNVEQTKLNNSIKRDFKGEEPNINKPQNEMKFSKKEIKSNSTQNVNGPIKYDPLFFKSDINNVIEKIKKLQSYKNIKNINEDDINTNKTEDYTKLTLNKKSYLDKSFTNNNIHDINFSGRKTNNLKYNTNSIKENLNFVKNKLTKVTKETKNASDLENNLRSSFEMFSINNGTKSSVSKFNKAKYTNHVRKVYSDTTFLEIKKDNMFSIGLADDIRINKPSKVINHSLKVNKMLDKEPYVMYENKVIKMPKTSVEKIENTKFVSPWKMNISEYERNMHKRDRQPFQTRKSIKKKIKKEGFYEMKTPGKSVINKPREPMGKIIDRKSSKRSNQSLYEYYQQSITNNVALIQKPFNFTSSKKKLQDIKLALANYKSKWSNTVYNTELTEKNKHHYDFSIKVQTDDRHIDSSNKIRMSKILNNATDQFGKPAADRVQKKMFTHFHNNVKDTNLRIYDNNFGNTQSKITENMPANVQLQGKLFEDYYQKVQVNKNTLDNNYKNKLSTKSKNDNIPLDVKLVKNKFKNDTITINKQSENPISIKQTVNFTKNGNTINSIYDETPYKRVTKKEISQKYNTKNSDKLSDIKYVQPNRRTKSASKFTAVNKNLRKTKSEPKLKNILTTNLKKYKSKYEFLNLINKDSTKSIIDTFTNIRNKAYNFFNSIKLYNSNKRLGQEIYRSKNVNKKINYLANNFNTKELNKINSNVHNNLIKNTKQYPKDDSSISKQNENISYKRLRRSESLVLSNLSKANVTNKLNGNSANTNNVFNSINNTNKTSFKGIKADSIFNVTNLTNDNTMSKQDNSQNINYFYNNVNQLNYNKKYANYKENITNDFLRFNEQKNEIKLTFNSPINEVKTSKSLPTVYNNDYNKNLKTNRMDESAFVLSKMSQPFKTTSRNYDTLATYVNSTLNYNESINRKPELKTEFTNRQVDQKNNQSLINYLLRDRTKNQSNIKSTNVTLVEDINN